MFGIAVCFACFCASMADEAIAATARSGSACQGVDQPPKALAFVIFRVELRPAGEFILTFENGEVWQQYQLDKKMKLERGEQVVIRRSSGGIYTLVARDGQSTRVKRMR
jgi:hypothetical protein